MSLKQILICVCSLSFLPGAFAQPLPERTALDDYIEKQDSSYRWKVVHTSSDKGLTTVVVDMVSQTWRTSDEVNRTEWQHWLTLCFPDRVRSNIGFLYIGGGSNRGAAPQKADNLVQQIAAATGTVVAELKMIPNQPLVFDGDGQRRSEDDLIGYTWHKYLETGDPTWPARNPMVKSAVRAMDTITAVMAGADGGEQEVNKFVVAGGSKRGWTTWLTGAVDERVVGISPAVIDVLNADASMRHHFAAYGFWAPSIGNYVQHRIMERIDAPRMKDLYQLVDPFYYRHRLKIPKFVLNAAGDQFFLPDSSKFYWDDLQGPKYLRYVPNADHGLDGSDAMESVIAFYSLVLAGKEGPTTKWSTENDTLTVESDQPPKEVRLWQATNPLARDFRMETLGGKYTSTRIKPDEDGKYRVELTTPEDGWTAYFVEMTYDIGVKVPLKLTTGIQVRPDILPFKDKASDQPATATVVCHMPEGTPAATILAGVKQLAASGAFPARELQTDAVEGTCYINWQPPTEQFQRQVVGLAKWLKDQGCKKVTFQLESGPGATLSPGHRLDSVAQ